MEIEGSQTKYNQNIASPSGTKIMRKLDGNISAKKNVSLIFGTFAVILLGIVTGYFLSGYSSTEVGSKESSELRGVEVSENEAGIDDISDDEDILEEEGVLVEGGLEGEGTHHLDRGLGADKYVYLTSTGFDLQGFVGEKVKVWGKALSPLHVGYLMEVVKINTID